MKFSMILLIGGSLKKKGHFEKEGISASKLQLKTRLARSIGLGHGSDSDDAALKALYWLCSAETPLSIERAILIAQQTHDCRLIEWAAWRAGLLTTPRVGIPDADLLDGEDIFLPGRGATKGNLQFCRATFSRSPGQAEPPTGKRHRKRAPESSNLDGAQRTPALWFY